MGKRFLTTVEITDTHLKVVQAATGNGGARVTFCDIREIAPQSDKEITKIFSSIIKQKALKPAEVVVIIPRRFVIVRHLSLPSHTNTEIEKMVNLQVIKQVPYPKEDIVVDWLLLDKDPSGYAKVLVVAVHKEVLERYLGIVAGAGVSVNRFVLSSESLAQWYAFQEKKSRRTTTGATLVVNVDTTGTELCFCRGERLIFSRSINFGARDITDDQIAAFVEQIALTVETYAQEDIGTKISQVAVISSSPAAGMLKEKLGAAQAPMPVDILDPFGGIPHKKTVAVPQGVSVAVNLGVVVAGSKKAMNLLPPEVRDTRQVTQKKKDALRCAVLGLGVCVLAVTAGMVKIHSVATYLEHLRSALAETEPQVNQIQEKIQRLHFIEQRLNPQLVITDVIYELYAIAPPDISFKAVHYTEDGTLNLHGMSNSEASVNVLQKNLVNSAFFENVTLQYATKRRVFKGELTDFKITCQTAGRAQTP